MRGGEGGMGKGKSLTSTQVLKECVGEAGEMFKAIAKAPPPPNTYSI